MGRWLEDSETSARAQSNPRRLFNSSCAWLDWRDELAGGEIIEGAEAAAKFGVAQAAVAVERAYKLDGVALGFIGVAIQTARNEIAVGIAAEVCLRNHVVEAPSLGDEATETVEAAAALAGVHGPAERLGLEEVGLREAVTTRSAGAGRWAAIFSTHIPLTSKGSRRRTTCWARQLHSTKCKTPRAISRRTVSRVNLLERPTPRASQEIENCNCSLPSSRL